MLHFLATILMDHGACIKASICIYFLAYYALLRNIGYFFPFFSKTWQLFAFHVAQNQSLAENAE